MRLTDSRRDLRYIYLTPHSAAERLLKWDYGIKPEPFTVEARGENAHVVTAGNKVAKKYRHKKKHGDGTRKPPKEAILVKTSKTQVPRRVGGKEPVNYSVRHEFGLRAFKGMTGVSASV